MTGVQADVAEAREKAINIISKLPINPETMMYVLQEKREQINNLSWELAKSTSYDDEPEKILKRALMVRERETALQDLDDLLEAYEKEIWTREEYVPENGLTGAYTRIEIVVNGFELP